MIVLDTSVLRSMRVPDGAAFHVLRLLAQQTEHALALPEMVLEEYVSNYRRQLEGKTKAARAANADLQGWAGTWDGRERWEGLPYPDLATATDNVETMLRTQFTILPLAGDAAIAALKREANRQAPARGPEAKDPGGARDAAIWLTVLAACPTASPSNVYFVATNTNDFGKERLRTELQIESPFNLVYCIGFDGVLTELATPTDKPKSEAISVLRTQNVKLAVERLVRSQDAAQEMLSLLLARVAFSAALVGALDRRTTIDLHQVDEDRTHTYRVGEDSIVVGEMSWHARVTFAEVRDSWSYGEPAMLQGTFSFRTTVVVHERQDGAILALRVPSRGPFTLVTLAAGPATLPPI